MKQLAIQFGSIDELNAFLAEEETQNHISRAKSVLAQVYVSGSDEGWIKRILTAMSQLPEKVVIVGATTFGEICEGKPFSGTNVLLLGLFDTVNLVEMQRKCGAGEEADAAHDLVDLLNGAPEDVKGVLLLATTRSIDCGKLLSAIHERSPGMPLFGGGAGDDVSVGRTLVFSRASMLDAGLVAVGLCGGTLEVLRRTYLGWAPMGKKMRITKTEGFTVKTIDNEPAFDVYRRYLGIEKDDHFFLNAMEFPFLLERRGEVLARVPVLAPGDDSITFIADIYEGEEVTFGYAHVDTILDRVENTEAAVRKFAPEAINVYSCGCRHFVMQKDVALELAPFQQIAPTSGFFTYGEFCDLGEQSPLFNSTLVVVAMREGLPKTDELKATPYMNREKFDIYAHNHARILSRFQHFTEAITKDLEHANRELAILADHDALTGLSNRRVLESLLSGETERSARYGRPYCVILCDVDHFKKFNDDFGHPIGDFVLQTLARAIEQESRTADTVCRYGGEEFVILMPETKLDAALQCAERMRAHIENLAIAHDTRLLPSVTMSFGIAAYPEHGATSLEMLTAADKAMYEAKRRGRNRVCIAGQKQNTLVV